MQAAYLIFWRANNSAHTLHAFAPSAPRCARSCAQASAHGGGQQAHGMPSLPLIYYLSPRIYYLYYLIYYLIILKNQLFIGKVAK